MKNLRFLSWCLCASLMLMLGACGGDNEPGDSTTESSGSNNANANDASANSVLARMEMPNMKKIEKEMAANTKLLVHETSDSYGINGVRRQALGRGLNIVIDEQGRAKKVVK